LSEKLANAKRIYGKSAHVRFLAINTMTSTHRSVANQPQPCMDNEGGSGRRGTREDKGRHGVGASTAGQGRAGWVCGRHEQPMMGRLAWFTRYRRAGLGCRVWAGGQDPQCRQTSQSARGHRTPPPSRQYLVATAASDLPRATPRFAATAATPSALSVAVPRRRRACTQERRAHGARPA